MTKIEFYYTVRIKMKGDIYFYMQKEMDILFISRQYNNWNIYLTLFSPNFFNAPAKCIIYIVKYCYIFKMYTCEKNDQNHIGNLKMIGEKIIE